MVTSVAVTGLNSADNPGPGLAVLRSLQDQPELEGYRWVGLAYDALDTGIHNPGFLDQAFLIPYPTQGEEALLERLADIHERCPLEAIIPTLDSELMGFTRIADDLKEMGIATLLPTPEVLQLRSKAHLAEFCEEQGFRFPETRVIFSPEQLQECADMGFPLVVKGLFHGAHLAHSLAEAQVWFEATRRQWGLPILVQQHLSGEEYDVVGVGSRSGENLGLVAMRKLRITPKGTAWAGITVYHPPLLELAEAFMEALGWVGPVEFEFLLDSATDEFHLLEINPRFPSWVYLSAGAGLNLPAQALREALGQSPQPLHLYQPGCTFVRHSIDLICPLEHLESLTTRGELSLAG